MGGSDDPGQDLTVRALLRQLFVGLGVLVVVVGLAGFFLRVPLTVLSESFVDAYGLAGVFGGVMITDTFALTHEPLLFAAYVGGLAFWPVFAAASTASVLAGPTGWAMGHLLGRTAVVQRLFTRYRISPFMHRYGVWAIALAALTPFPYSVATWASGAAGLSLKTVVIGSLFRVPKVLFYFGLIVFGWGIGAA